MIVANNIAITIYKNTETQLKNSNDPAELELSAK